MVNNLKLIELRKILITIAAFAIIFTASFLLSNQSNHQFALTSTGSLEVVVKFGNLSFNRPVDLQDARDGSSRLFAVEQEGRIYGIDYSSASNDTSLFLDISGKVIGPSEGGSEEGLLGLAFHPNYSENGYFYVDYTTDSPRRTVISRFSVDESNASLADPLSEVVILEVEQPYANHNGGQIAFGPDGLLYVAMGDGGSSGDPLGHAQNLSTLLGSILRIDVDSTDPGLSYSIPSTNPFKGNILGFREEIYAYGLRNPWRFSFDSETGDLWVADVGQNAIEEIDIVVPAGNYGWAIKEGSSCYNPAIGCNSTGLIDPIHEYGHGVGRSITGGYVYRGAKIPSLIGMYIYADFVSGRIWALNYTDGEVIENLELFDTDLLISSFGVDAANELYILSFDGRIYAINEHIETGTTSTTSQTDTTSVTSTTPTSNVNSEIPTTQDVSLILVASTVSPVIIAILVIGWYLRKRG